MEESKHGAPFCLDFVFEYVNVEVVYFSWFCKNGKHTWELISREKGKIKTRNPIHGISTTIRAKKSLDSKPGGQEGSSIKETIQKQNKSKIHETNKYVCQLSSPWIKIKRGAKTLKQKLKHYKKKKSQSNWKNIIQGKKKSLLQNQANMIQPTRKPKQNLEQKNHANINYRTTKNKKVINITWNSSKIPKKRCEGELKDPKA